MGSLPAFTVEAFRTLKRHAGTNRKYIVLDKRGEEDKIEKESVIGGVMSRAKRSNGFTLIELMLVGAIIGVLASIAIPKFSGLIIKSKEASIKGKLGSLRGALSIYYSDNEGNYPNSGTLLSQVLYVCLVNRYIDAIPTFSIPTVTNVSHTVTTHRVWNAPTAMDSWMVSGWGYNYDESIGRIAINCTHSDSNGATIWTGW